jgi:hypothetical protein
MGAGLAAGVDSADTVAVVRIATDVAKMMGLGFNLEDDISGISDIGEKSFRLTFYLQSR